MACDRLKFHLNFGFKKRRKNFSFFSQHDENQDQVLIHLSLLIRMGTQGRSVNNCRPTETKHGREGGGGGADCEKNKISMADLQEQLSRG